MEWESETLAFLKVKTKIAEQTESWDEMSVNIKRLVKLKSEIGLMPTSEERQMFNVSFKNKIGSRKSSWQKLISLETKELSKHTKSTKNNNTNNTNNHNYNPNYNNYKLIKIKEFKKNVQNEITVIVYEVVSTIDDFILPYYESTTTTSINRHKEDDTYLYFLKMKGDYQKYLCEVAFDKEDIIQDDVMRLIEETQKQYELTISKGRDLIEKDVVSGSSVVLGCYLNFAVFLYEVARDVDMAIKIADEGVNSGMNWFNTSVASDEMYPLLLQILQENVRMWNLEQTKKEKMVCL